MSVALAKIGAFKPELHSTDECILELCKYGHPAMFHHDNGWSCKVVVFVMGEGAEFNVKSGFGHPTLKIAVNICYERLIDSIKKIKEAG